MTEITVRCTACARLMVVRRNSKTRSRFLSCSGWEERDENDRPKCTETAPFPESIRMREQGAPVLPGF